MAPVHLHFVYLFTKTQNFAHAPFTHFLTYTALAFFI